MYIIYFSQIIYIYIYIYIHIYIYIYIVAVPDSVESGTTTPPVLIIILFLFVGDMLELQPLYIIAARYCYMQATYFDKYLA